MPAGGMHAHRKKYALRIDGTRLNHLVNALPMEISSHAITEYAPNNLKSAAIALKRIAVRRGAAMNIGKQ